MKLGFQLNKVSIKNKQTFDMLQQSHRIFILLYIDKEVCQKRFFFLAITGKYFDQEVIG